MGRRELDGGLMAILIGFALATVALTASLTAQAQEVQDNIWHLYHGDDLAATLVVIDRAELESPEPYFALSFQCTPDEEWELVVANVDERTLGETIADGGPVILSFVLDGAPSSGGLGSIFPELRFSEMFGEWEFTAPFDLAMVEELAAAKSVAIEGTGAQYALPEEGLAAAVTEFRTICAKYEEMR